jgi:outer membrane protein TolC
MNANAASTYRSLWILLAAIALGLPFSAHALQPLEAFIRSARKQNPDNLKARANLEQQQAQADVALGHVLPGISIKGNYDRNQYASSLSVSLDPTAPPREITFQHYNQLTGAAAISVTLVDLASFQRVTAARTSAEAFARQTEATALQVESQVAQDYFQLMANLALVASSQRALDVTNVSQRATPLNGALLEYSLGTSQRKPPVWGCRRADAAGTLARPTLSGSR